MLKFGCLLLLGVSIACAQLMCDQFNNLCKHDGTCTNKKECVCADPYEGDDCSVVKAEKGGSGCGSIDCGIHGHCVTVGGAAKCVCDLSYHGDTCQFNRLHLHCTAKDMLMVVNPYAGFTGRIYIEGKRLVSECGFSPVPSPGVTNDDIPDSIGGHYLRLSHDDNKCGAIFKTFDKDVDKVSYERSVVMEAGDNIIISGFGFFKAHCIYNSKTITVNGDDILIEEQSPSHVGKPAIAVVALVMQIILVFIA